MQQNTYALRFQEHCPAWEDAINSVYLVLSLQSGDSRENDVTFSYDAYINTRQFTFFWGNSWLVPKSFEAENYYSCLL